MKAKTVHRTDIRIQIKSSRKIQQRILQRMNQKIQQRIINIKNIKGCRKTTLFVCGKNKLIRTKFHNIHIVKYITKYKDM